jgi:hypothetical protein
MTPVLTAPGESDGERERDASTCIKEAPGFRPDPRETRVEKAWFQRLKLKYDKLR